MFDTGPPRQAAPYYLPLFIQTVILRQSGNGEKPPNVQETHNGLCTACIQMYMQGKESVRKL